MKVIKHTNLKSTNSANNIKWVVLFAVAGGNQKRKGR